MPTDTRLRYLFEAAQLGTMRAASEKMNVATSSVSRQIAELESELGLALIEKGRRRVCLTEAGEVVCQYFREKMSQEEAFLSHIQEMKSIRTGKIILAVGEAFVTQAFSDMLDKFMQQYPGMEVRVRVTNTTEVVDMVREDKAHVGLIFDISREPKIRARVVLNQPLKIIVHKDHPLGARDHISLKEVQDESLGLPEQGYRIRQVIQVAEQEEGVFLEGALVTNSLMLLTDFVKSGRGITILPDLVVHEELQKGHICAVPTENPVLNSTKTSLIVRVSRQLPVGAYRLLQNLEAHYSGLNSLTSDLVAEASSPK